MTSASALASSVWRPLAKRAARRYIAGESPDDAVTVCRELADGGLSSTVGFWNRSDDSPDDVTQRCIEALNAIGATPQDLLSILQAMKASGALRAELEII